MIILKRNTGVRFILENLLKERRGVEDILYFLSFVLLSKGYTNRYKIYFAFCCSLRV